MSVRIDIVDKSYNPHGNEWGIADVWTVIFLDPSSVLYRQGKILGIRVAVGDDIEILFRDEASCEAALEKLAQAILAGEGNHAFTRKFWGDQQVAHG